MAENKKFVFVLLSSYEHADKMAGAMQLAANMMAFDVEIDFFLMDTAALLAKKGFAETLVQKKDGFSPAADLMKTLIEDFGVKFYVCASCMKPFGLVPESLIEGASVKPGSYLGEMLMERQALTF